ncbi:histidinol-phosphate transaminase [Paenibacillus septentrionalis]|uniref:Histidinol-phosphate aminotransferase n=1 Tax=Paenibacillus septentrionalis TaxID=429342 RepID=A0ABW1V3S1_9BACL
MQPKVNIMHLPVYQPGKPIEDVKRELGLDEVIKLASNENPIGYSPKARAAMLDEIDHLHIYPDGASVDLTAVLASKLGVESNQIIFGTGSSDIILMICRAYLTAADETIMADETFSQYKHNCEVENTNIIEVPLKDGKHDLNAMLAAVTERTKVLWICNPNNPTGTIIGREELEAFLAKLPKHVLVVLDEAYGEYVTDPNFPNGITLIDRYPNIVVLRTFSKVYGLAANRIGYGVGEASVIRTINQVREPFNTGRLAQVAAKASLQDDEFLARSQASNTAGLNYLHAQFDRLGLQYFKGHGNFIMVDVRTPSMQIFDLLLRKGIIVRAGWKHYPNAIRVSVGTAEQNEKFIQALEEVLIELAVLQ